jgi:hypothetical protein
MLPVPVVDALPGILCLWIAELALIYPSDVRARMGSTVMVKAPGCFPSTGVLLIFDRSFVKLA